MNSKTRKSALSFSSKREFDSSQNFIATPSTLTRRVSPCKTRSDNAKPLHHQRPRFRWKNFTSKYPRQPSLHRLRSQKKLIQFCPLCLCLKQRCDASDIHECEFRSASINHLRVTPMRFKLITWMIVGTRQFYRTLCHQFAFTATPLQRVFQTDPGQRHYGRTVWIKSAQSLKLSNPHSIGQSFSEDFNFLLHRADYMQASPCHM